MTISDRIREISSKHTFLDFAAYPIDKDTCSFILNDGAQMSIDFVENKLRLTFHTESSDYGMLLHALTFELARNTDSTSCISFRELENMLRDNNSVPCADQALLESAENCYQFLKKIVVWPKQINKILENEHISASMLGGKSFFEQIKSLDDLHRMYCEAKSTERNEVPRLNTWEPKTGELSLIVDSKTKFDRVDTELFRLFWGLFDGIKIIKMVASESL